MAENSNFEHMKSLSVKHITIPPHPDRLLYKSCSQCSTKGHRFQLPSCCYDLWWQSRLSLLNNFKTDPLTALSIITVLKICIPVTHKSDWLDILVEWMTTHRKKKNLISAKGGNWTRCVNERPKWNSYHTDHAGGRTHTGITPDPLDVRKAWWL